MELADIADLKSAGYKAVSVRVRLPAPLSFKFHLYWQPGKTGNMASWQSPAYCTCLENRRRWWAARGFKSYTRRQRDVLIFTIFQRPQDKRYENGVCSDEIEKIIVVAANIGGVNIFSYANRKILISELRGSCSYGWWLLTATIYMRRTKLSV